MTSRAELAEDRRRFLLALYKIRGLLVGKRVTPATIAAIVETIEEAIT